MARVLRTPLARHDLKELGRYIAQESGNRDVAMRFLGVIKSRCTLYASQPLLGEACPDLGTTLRRFVVGTYVVFYQPLEDGIEVLRVLHSSRDMPTAWRERH